MKETARGYEWVKPEAIDTAKVEEISRKFDLSDILARIIVKRGMLDEEQLRVFLKPTLRDLTNPFKLDGLNICAERLARAVINREKILIHGDFDADGITSTAMLFLFLRKLGLEVYPFIPCRLSEGHGISADSLELALKSTCTLMITCDVGISANDEIEEFNSKGIDVIITDHHGHTGETLPQAAGIFNPALDPDGGFANLSGVGVAFYLLVALRTQLRAKGFFKENEEPDLKSYLDLVALGTVADVSSVAGENRILVRYGLDLLSKSPSLGLDALKRVSGLSMGRPLSYTDIAFRLAPRINAAGRMGDAMCAFDLLISEDFDSAMGLARKLEGYNLERRRVEKEILKVAKDMVESSDDHDEKHSFCLAGKNWHKGILGLAANRLSDLYGKTFCIMSSGEEPCRGSVRSVEPVNVLEVLEECSGHLIEYGGHELAGGFSIREEKIMEFAQEFAKAVKRAVNEKGNGRKKLFIDCELDIDAINGHLMEQIGIMQPHGPDNLELNFMAKGVRILSHHRMGAKHTRLLLKRKRDTIEAVAFDLTVPAECTENEVDIVFTPEHNYYGSQKSLRLLVKDIKF